MRRIVMIGRAIMAGTISSLILIAGYFLIVSLISSLDFAGNQFSQFWYFIISLALGFGVQFGLYRYLRAITVKMADAKIIAVSGTTSTAAMISCCTHYLANILPILGTVGIVTFVASYQIEIFWVGLLFNFLGIGFVISRLIKFKKHEKNNFC